MRSHIIYISIFAKEPKVIELIEDHIRRSKTGQVIIYAPTLGIVKDLSQRLSAEVYYSQHSLLDLTETHKHSITFTTTIFYYSQAYLLH